MQGINKHWYSVFALLTIPRIILFNIGNVDKGYCSKVGESNIYYTDVDT